MQATPLGLTKQSDKESRSRSQLQDLSEFILNKISGDGGQDIRSEAPTRTSESRRSMQATPAGLAKQSDTESRSRSQLPDFSEFILNKISGDGGQDIRSEAPTRTSESRRSMQATPVGLTKQSDTESRSRSQLPDE